MTEKAVYDLRTSIVFSKLVQPLRRASFRRLEQGIAKNGCDAPIPVWKRFVLEDFERYSICVKLQVPFLIQEMDFCCWEEAVVWVCEKQLRRKDLTEERRKYLIGVQLEAERVATAQRMHPGLGLYSDAPDEMDFLTGDHEKRLLPTAKSVALRIGAANHVSWNTVIKYVEYARMIESTWKKSPEAAQSILLGQVKISQKGVITLAGLPDTQLEDVVGRLKRAEDRHSKRNNMQIIVSEGFNAPPIVHRPPKPSVKDMPKHDPDAQIVALTYTVPSWGESIKRVRESVDIGVVTDLAKRKLIAALSNLMIEADALLDLVRDE